MSVLLTVVYLESIIIIVCISKLFLKEPSHEPSERNLSAVFS
jgi:hypothetical protein